MGKAAVRFYRLAKGFEVCSVRIPVTQALDAQYFLAKETPVDVGTARSNWQASIGRPRTGRIRAYSPYVSRHKKPYGAGGTKAEGANLSGVQSQGRNALANYKKGAIYISNNLPYIGPLDRGHSKQTSAGFVSRAVMRALKTTSGKIPRILDEELSK